MNSDNQGYGIFTPDDRSVYFLERYLSKLLRHPEFTATDSLVAVETLQSMIESGLYPISKLQVILLHLLSAKDLQSEQLLIDQLCKFWHKALHTWVPQGNYASVCRWLSRFLLKKAVLTHSALTKDFCIIKLNDFAHDEMTVKLFADCILKHDCRIIVPLAVLEMSLDERTVLEGDCDENETIEVCEMSLHHKYYFAKSLSSSQYLTDQIK